MLGEKWKERGYRAERLIEVWSCRGMSADRGEAALTVAAR
jgi:hypothetical protein